MQLSCSFSILGPLSGPSRTSSSPAAAFPGQNFCLDTSLLATISGIFISAEEHIYSFVAQIAQLFQACLHDFRKRPFLYLSRLLLLLWRHWVARNRRQNECSHTDCHQFTIKSVWQISTSSSWNSNRRA